MLSFDVDLVEKDFPLLFGLDEHFKHNCSTNEVKRTFTHHPSDTTIPIVFKPDHPHTSLDSEDPSGQFYVVWSVTAILYTREQLKKIDRQFGHPSTDAMINLLKRANNHEELSPEV